MTVAAGPFPAPRETAPAWRDGDLLRLRRELARGAPIAGALTEVDRVGAAELLDLDAAVRAETRGAGPLQPLLEDPAVTDVLVNGGEGVWVDRGAGLVRVDPGIPLDPPAVRRLATRLAAACGQRLDDASPVVDGTLPDGTRLHAVLPPLSATGTLVSLRTHRPRGLSLDELAASGTVAPVLLPVLRALVSRRANVLVSGATGAGKTTLLAALLSLVPGDERIVCIEESAELRPGHPHVVHLQVRRANVQRAGEVPLAELVRAAMRMRPDRIVLGECRGAEVRDVLAALNTGHEGGWATVHANTAADVPARLVALGALAELTEATTTAQAVSAVDAVVHLRRDETGVRRLVEIGVLVREGTTMSCRPAVTSWGASPATEGRVRPGPAWPSLAERLGLPLDLLGPIGSVTPAAREAVPLPPGPAARRGRHMAEP